MKVDFSQLSVKVERSRGDRLEFWGAPCFAPDTVEIEWSGKITVEWDSSEIEGDVEEAILEAIQLETQSCDGVDFFFSAIKILDGFEWEMICKSLGFADVEPTEWKWR